MQGVREMEKISFIHAINIGKEKNTRPLVKDTLNCGKNLGTFRLNVVSQSSS
jgi:hypothetical protein